DLRVAGVDGHAWADSRLCEIYRSDIAALQIGKGLRQLGFERADELAPRRGRNRGLTFATNKNDAGGERVGTETDRTRTTFRTHRPSSTNTEIRWDQGIEKGVPACARSAFLVVGLRLFEGVVNSDRKCRVSLLGDAMHHLRHARQEEVLGFLPATVAVST